jgi:hypothetical protein
MQIFFEHYQSRRRQSATNLAHTIGHYDDLAPRTSFAQRFLDLLHFSEQRLSSHFSPNFGFLSLNNYMLCNGDSCIPTESLIWDLKRAPQLYTTFHEQFCPTKSLFLTFKGQLFVSRERILQNSKAKVCHNMFWIMWNIFVYDVVIRLIMI